MVILSGWGFCHMASKNIAMAAKILCRKILDEFAA